MTTHVVESSTGTWHYHLSETGKQGEPAFCGLTVVWPTTIPVTAWEPVPKKRGPRDTPFHCCRVCEQMRPVMVGLELMLAGRPTEEEVTKAKEILLTNEQQQRLASRKAWAKIAKQPLKMKLLPSDRSSRFYIWHFGTCLRDGITRIRVRHPGVAQQEGEVYTVENGALLQPNTYAATQDAAKSCAEACRVMGRNAVATRMGEEVEILRKTLAARF